MKMCQLRKVVSNTSFITRDRKFRVDVWQFHTLTKEYSLETNFTDTDRSNLQ